MSQHEEAGPGVVIPNRPTQRKSPDRDHSTAQPNRTSRRLALLEAMGDGRVLDFVGHLNRRRALLSDELLDETPDQEAEARCWGERYEGAGA